MCRGCHHPGTISNSGKERAMDPNHTGLKVLLAIILTIAFVVLGILVYVSFYPLGTALP